MKVLTIAVRAIIGYWLFFVFALIFPISANAEVSIVNMNFASGTFIYNPRTLHWQAINSKGKVVRAGHGSGGRNYCPDTRRRCRTPTGTFHIISKRGAACKSSVYPIGRGGSPMPYCMFFSKYYAVHGSYHVPNYNASHGCIRITPNDAHWLYNNFMSIGTKVIVKPY